jgi:hypothetical protein
MAPTLGRVREPDDTQGELAGCRVVEPPLTVVVQDERVP